MNVHVLGCWGAYPEAGQATTGLLVETDKHKILVDVGSGVLAQLLDVCAIPELTALIVTHHHHDHTADFGVLTYALLLARLMGKRKRPLPMYMLKGSEERMRDLSKEPLADVHIVNATSEIQIDGVRVTFAPTIHPVPCLAVRIEYSGEVFVFSADTAYSEPVIALAKNADLFLCESSMYKGQEKEAKGPGHVTAPQAGQMAGLADVKQLVLTHLPHYGNHQDLITQAMETYHGPVTLAQHRMILQVGGQQI
ncbi:MBL fold metallo-hydrolase [Alicyclobacillus ferrooxydans]|uniref:Metallo-beta-lactamase domain-containing protein n=1 Tax=Alicyclobacillus ferrooxydans TaxID=471514 RepID=A0A0P9CBZ5_9BACL|nr:MBL fold metallo-hydrolase [Alicyclobacillus ferrooxydans]KPV42987.1 hypothetical protein AN477_14740 [Alicyclobacillus ferrooxydans]